MPTTNPEREIETRARKLANELTIHMGPDTVDEKGVLNAKGRATIREKLIGVVADLGDAAEVEKMVDQFMKGVSDEPLDVQMAHALTKRIRELVDELKEMGTTIRHFASRQETGPRIFELGEARGFGIAARALLAMTADTIDHAMTCDCAKGEEPEAAEGEVSQ